VIIKLTKIFKSLLYLINYVFKVWFD